MPSLDQILAIILGGGRGSAPVSAHPAALQARRSHRRQIPPDRYPHQQLHQLRHLPHRRADPVQLGLAAPPHHPHLQFRHLPQRLGADLGRGANHDQQRLVPGHRRCRAQAALRDQSRRRALTCSSWRATIFTAWITPPWRVSIGRRTPTSPWPCSRSPPRTPAAWACSSATPATRIIDFAEKPKDPARQAEMVSRSDPEKPYLGSMGIYLFKTEVLEQLLTENQFDDFGIHVIPHAIGSHNVFCFEHRRLLGRHRHHPLLLRDQPGPDHAQPGLQPVRLRQADLYPPALPARLDHSKQPAGKRAPGRRRLPDRRGNPPFDHRRAQPDPPEGEDPGFDHHGRRLLRRLAVRRRRLPAGWLHPHRDRLRQPDQRARSSTRMPTSGADVVIRPSRAASTWTTIPGTCATAWWSSPKAPPSHPEPSSPLEGASRSVTG